MKSLYQHIRDVFLSGVLVVVPISLTLYILFILFKWLDKILFPLLKILHNKYNFPLFTGIGLLALVIIIFIFGILARNFFGKSLLKLMEKIIGSLPIIKNIYSTTKDISNAFLGTKKNKIFKKVVLVDYPHKGTKAIGFLTNEYTFLDTDKENFVSVFIPTTPNPTSGFYLIYNINDVKILDISTEEALKMIISAGAVEKNPKKDDNA